MNNRKTVLLETCHVSSIGGGENYLMRLAMALDNCSDFYMMNNISPEFTLLNGFGKQFKTFNNDFQPDIHIQCNYNCLVEPKGKINILLTFFPKKDVVINGKMFDKVLTICKYSQTWVKNYWNYESDIIYPAIDISNYKNNPIKKHQIVSLGHFFFEEDGHSKNQHILISIFKNLPNYKLILIGNAYASDMGYVNECQQFANGYDVEFYFNADFNFIKQTLANSEFLWHANGYLRTDPSQTEHFGIVVLEALASGCVPIVHNSGGAKDIEHSYVWNTPEDLIERTINLYSIHPIPTFPEKYTLDYFNQEVVKWLNQF
jgi:glycosyltransferase involved in cell wall biosynthesis